MDCTLENAQAASAADMLGLDKDNRLGQALLGNTKADIGEVGNDLISGDLPGAGNSGTNVAIDKGADRVLHHLAHKAPGTTTMLTDTTMIIGDNGFAVEESILIHTEESIVPRLLGSLNLVKKLWDASGLIAAGSLCLFFQLM